MNKTKRVFCIEISDVGIFVSREVTTDLTTSLTDKRYEKITYSTCLRLRQLTRNDKFYVNSGLTYFAHTIHPYTTIYSQRKG